MRKNVRKRSRRINHNDDWIEILSNSQSASLFKSLLLPNANSQTQFLIILFRHYDSSIYSGYKRENIDDGHK